MWKNYLLTSLRSLRRNKRFCVLNIVGLSIGLTACLLMTAYVIHELSFERTHALRERIFRINGNVPYGERTLRNAIVDVPLGPAAEAAVPEIERTVRLLRLSNIPVKVEDREFKESEAFAAEPQVLDVFTLPLRQGHPQTALAEPFTVVLSESLGRKYFGERDPVGRKIQLRIERNHDFLVTGVMKVLPSNTVLNRPLFVSFATFEKLQGENMRKWTGWGSATTFALLRPEADPKAVEAKITATALPYLDPTDQKMTYALQPLREIYLHTMNNDLDNSGNQIRVAVFALIAALMLVVAAIGLIAATLVVVK